MSALMGLNRCLFSRQHFPFFFFKGVHQRARLPNQRSRRRAPPAIGWLPVDWGEDGVTVLSPAVRTCAIPPSATRAAAPRSFQQVGAPRSGRWSPLTCAPQVSPAQPKAKQKKNNKFVGRYWAGFGWVGGLVDCWVDPGFRNSWVGRFGHGKRCPPPPVVAK